MVPSWTETLVEAGVSVVGRTRYCIHPSDRVRDIPVVGGTKDWDFDKIRALSPDLTILDKEENPKFMSEQSEFAFFATHVTSVTEVPAELRALHGATSVNFCDSGAHVRAGVSLLDLADEWEKVLKSRRSSPAGTSVTASDVAQLPGIIEWGRKPSAPVNSLVYVIWKNPWMAVTHETFVGSMLEVCGFPPTLRAADRKYPEVDLAALPKDTLLLFSSEPYPFSKKREGIDELGCPYAFVNGESFSWFGVRALRFLQGLEFNQRP